MQAAKSIGGKVFAIDKRKMSLDMAKTLGADAVINSVETDAGHCAERPLCRSRSCRTAPAQRA